MTPYRLQLVPQLKDTDKPARHEFCTDMLEKLEDDGFDDRLVFSDEVTFHLSGKVNKHNTRIWGTVYGPFFFEGATVNSEAYLAMLQNWLMD